MTAGATPVVVCEFFTAGGRLPGGDEEAPDLRREGLALLLALTEDLASLPGVSPSAVVLPELADELPARVDADPAGPDPVAASCRALGRRPGALLWPVAPETRGRLARLVGAGPRCGAGAVGPDARTVRRAADRWRLLRRLSRDGVPVPPTAPARGAEDAVSLARELGGDVVVKPGRGCGGAGVARVRGVDAVAGAWRRAAALEPFFPPLVQSFVPGAPASVTVLAAGTGARPLALNRQRIRFSPEARYLGGVTPFRHPDRTRAEAAAADAVRSVGGMSGLVGVDLVLSGGGPVVMEVNPRLTTSYLGLRRHLGATAAAAAVRTAGVPAPTTRRRAPTRAAVPPRVPDGAPPSAFDAAGPA